MMLSVLYSVNWQKSIHICFTKKIIQWLYTCGDREERCWCKTFSLHKNDFQSVNDTDSQHVKIWLKGLIFIDLRTTIDEIYYCDVLSSSTYYLSDINISSILVTCLQFSGIILTTKTFCCKFPRQCHNVRVFKISKYVLKINLSPQYDISLFDSQYSISMHVWTYLRTYDDICIMCLYLQLFWSIHSV